MDHLTFHEADNMGGVRAFRFSPIENIDSLPITVDSVVLGDPDFTDDNTWYEGRVQQDGADFKEEEAVKTGGPLWEVEFRGNLPGDSAAMRANLDQIVRHHHIVDVIDNNGLTRRMGTLRNPARISIKPFTTGGTAAALHGYTLHIRWTSDCPTPIVEEDDSSGSGSLSGSGL